MKSTLLTTAALILLHTLSTEAQSLDDGWASNFGLPGIEGRTVDIVEDGAGGFYALELMEKSLASLKYENLHVARHHWNGVAWRSLDIPVDTLELQGLTIVPDPSGGMLLEPRSGSLLMHAERVADAGALLLRFDAEQREWSLPPYQFSEPGSFPMRGEDERFYSLMPIVGDDTERRLYVLEEERWVEVPHSIPSLTDGTFRLLGVSQDGTPYMVRGDQAFDSVRILTRRYDTLLWYQGEQLNALPYPFTRDGRIHGVAFADNQLYLLRETWDLNERNRPVNSVFSVVRVTPSGYLPVADPLDKEIIPYYNSERPEEGPLVVDADGTLYISTLGGLLSWDGTKWDISQPEHRPGYLVRLDDGTIIARSISSDDLRFAGATLSLFDREREIWRPLHDPDAEYGGRSGGDSPIVQSGEGVVVTGPSALAGERTIAGDLLRFDGTTWSVEATGLERDYPRYSTSVTQVVKHPEKGYYIGGTFDSAGGLPIKNMAWYDGEGWSPLGDTNLFNRSLHQMSLHNGMLYALGLHEKWNATRDTSFGFTSIFARWDGQEWRRLCDSVWINGGRFLIDGEPGEGTIYFGGWFSGADMIRVNAIAALDRNGWSDMNGGARGQKARVWAFSKEYDDLYAAGKFRGMGESEAFSIARWDGERWHMLDSGLSRAVEGEKVDGWTDPADIQSIAENDRYLVVGGLLRTAGTMEYGSPRRVDLGAGVAFWDKEEETWNTLGSGLLSPYGWEGSASNVLLAGDTVWVTGDFNYAGRKPSAGIARFVIPPAYIAEPEVPATLDFGEARPGDTIMAYLPVTNPATSTRTARGTMERPQGPFGITFDGIFQGSSGQTSLLPVTFTPTEHGYYEDTVMLRLNGSGEDLPVILRGNTTTASVAGNEGRANALDLRIGPNPMTRRGRISFTLPRPGGVEVTLYSSDGRKVRVLADRDMSAGSQVVTWDAEDLPRGSYICQVSWSGGESVAMVVLQ